jgi:hypothetical protein
MKQDISHLPDCIFFGRLFAFWDRVSPCSQASLELVILMPQLGMLGLQVCTPMPGPHYSFKAQEGVWLHNGKKAQKTLWFAVLWDMSAYVNRKDVSMLKCRGNVHQVPSLPASAQWKRQKRDPCPSPQPPTITMPCSSKTEGPCV